MQVKYNTFPIIQQIMILKLLLVDYDKFNWLKLWIYLIWIAEIK